MKKNFRSIFSLVLSMALLLSLTIGTTAFANSVGSNPKDINQIEQSLRGRVTLDSDSKITSGDSCTITLHLDQSYYAPYFRAGAAGNSSNMVDCTVTTPTGHTYPLGTIMADGSTTPNLYYTGYAPAGDYVFNFSGTNYGTTGFAAFIYKDY